MSKGKGKFLFWGAIFGFLAGLLLAPKKGSELRKEAKDKFEGVKENPREVLQETYNAIKEKINNISENDIISDDIKISEEEIVISKSFYDEGDTE